MDRQGSSDSLGPKSVFGSSWVKKKTRYEDEDLSMSPPDESGFFSLRFGAQRNKSYESMYDRINKELGLSAEGTKGPLTPELNIAPAARVSGPSAAHILLGPSGIVLESCRNQQINSAVSVISNSSTEIPKIVIPSTILEKKEGSTRSSCGGAPESPELSFVAQQDIDSLVLKARSGRPTRKISMNLAETIDQKFADSFQELRIEHSHSQEQLKPNCPVIPNFAEGVSLKPPLIDSIPAVTGARDRRRKTSAPPSLNPMKASNFFFTGGLFSSVATTSASTMTSSEAAFSISQEANADLVQTTNSAVSEPTSPMRHIVGNGVKGNNLTLEETTSLMERATEAAALEPKTKMGKRRPKASTLREMNFWAPQSM